MFSNIIEFQCSKEFIENNKDNLPVPTKLNIPDWFKKLKHHSVEKTIKGCMPFLDTLTSGYLLKLDQDIYLEHNVEVDGEKISRSLPAIADADLNTKHTHAININYKPLMENSHPLKQIGECPYGKKNKNFSIMKINNPWLIKTPPGYSCLFLPPLNNQDDRFSIIPGIVDTDDFKLEVNFPFVVNGDKYPELKTTLKRGTPYVQVIPFKREKWKMKIVEKKEGAVDRSFFYFKQVVDNYKNRYWKKKQWK